ncbi:MAG: N-acetyltransferase [Anaerolineaceae bacterium]|nr:MAG: N-acetyltransferase [Anaerolineaceae bacterium]
MNDLTDLISVSIRAFHSDIFVGAETLKGPPGYDSLEFHIEMLNKSSHFYKIVCGQKIIGGFWLMQQKHDEAYLYRIFLDPDYHHMSIGLKSFDFLFKKYPSVKIWSLKTPKWNIRTPKFYRKIGFEISKEDEKFLYFTMNK